MFSEAHIQVLMTFIHIDEWLQARDFRTFGNEEVPTRVMDAIPATHRLPYALYPLQMFNELAGQTGASKHERSHGTTDDSNSAPSHEESPHGPGKRQKLGDYEPTWRRNRTLATT